MKFIKGYSKCIDSNYNLKISTCSDEDFDRIITMCTTVHGENIQKYVEFLFKNHPLHDETFWIYIEDSNSQEILSLVVLLPSRWNIKGISIPICEMELVGTVEKHRGKQLIKKLIEIYEKVMQEKKYLVSVIRGIPYYYRRFGFTFAIPLDERIILPADSITQNFNDKISIRKAHSGDIEEIERLYGEYYRSFFIYTPFDDKQFKTKFLNEKFDNRKRTTYILEENGFIVGFFSIGDMYDFQGISIISSHLTPFQIDTIFHFLKRAEKNHMKTDLQINVSLDSSIGVYLLELGGAILSRYSWQVKIPQVHLFFKILKPIFEKRLQESEFRNLTEKVTIGNYHQDIEIQFMKGSIKEIKHSNFVNSSSLLDMCDLRVPDPLLYNLLLGDKSIEEILCFFPDTKLNSASRKLLDILFPKKLSNLLSFY